MNGWVKIHRKILKWEWWDDVATRNVFLYLLIKANHKKGEWKKHPLKRGQIIIGREKLALECGLKVQPTRRALNNLQNSQQITIKTTNKFSLITIINYDSYQQNNQQVTSKPTNKQPANQPQTRSKEKKKKRNITSKGDFVEMTEKQKQIWHEDIKHYEQVTGKEASKEIKIKKRNRILKMVQA